MNNDLRELVIEFIWMSSGIRLEGYIADELITLIRTDTLDNRLIKRMTVLLLKHCERTDKDYHEVLKLVNAIGNLRGKHE